MGGEGSGRKPDIIRKLMQAPATNVGTDTFTLPNFSGLKDVARKDKDGVLGISEGGTNQTSYVDNAIVYYPTSYGSLYSSALLTILTNPAYTNLKVGGSSNVPSIEIKPSKSGATEKIYINFNDRSQVNQGYILLDSSTASMDFVNEYGDKFFFTGDIHAKPIGYGTGKIYFGGATGYANILMPNNDESLILQAGSTSAALQLQGRTGTLTAYFGGRPSTDARPGAFIGSNGSDVPVRAEDATTGNLNRFITTCVSMKDGTGDLAPTGSAGLVFDEGKNIEFGTGTGTIIGESNTQLFSFWGNTPISQPTTSSASATFTANTSANPVFQESTFDGYTIEQVVKALRDVGLLA